jgi:hypothetical protein
MWYTASRRRRGGLLRDRLNPAGPEPGQLQPGGPAAGGSTTAQVPAIAGPVPKDLALTGGTGTCRSIGDDGTLVEFGDGKGKLTLHVLGLVPRGGEPDTAGLGSRSSAVVVRQTAGAAVCWTRVAFRPGSGRAWHSVYVVVAHDGNPHGLGGVDADQVEEPGAAAEVLHERWVGIALTGRAEPPRPRSYLFPVTMMCRCRKRAASRTGPSRPP